MVAQNFLAAGIVSNLNLIAEEEHGAFIQRRETRPGSPSGYSSVVPVLKKVNSPPSLVRDSALARERKVGRDGGS